MTYCLCSKQSNYVCLHVLLSVLATLVSSLILSLPSMISSLLPFDLVHVLLYLWSLSHSPCSWRWCGSLHRNMVYLLSTSDLTTAIPRTTVFLYRSQIVFSTSRMLLLVMLQLSGPKTSWIYSQISSLARGTGTHAKLFPLHISLPPLLFHVTCAISSQYSLLDPLDHLHWSVSSSTSLQTHDDDDDEIAYFTVGWKSRAIFVYRTKNMR